jgi:hypothetical protein
MTRYPWILLLSLCLAPQVLAVEPNPEAIAKSERNAELSSDLKQFVRGAISEGLLTPAKPENPAPDKTSQSDGMAAAMPSALVPEKPQVMSARDSACTGLYALDFSDLLTLQQITTPRRQTALRLPKRT